MVDKSKVKISGMNVKINLSVLTSARYHFYFLNGCCYILSHVFLEKESLKYRVKFTAVFRRNYLIGKKVVGLKNSRLDF